MSTNENESAPENASAASSKPKRRSRAFRWLKRFSLIFISLVLLTGIGGYLFRNRIPVVRDIVLLHRLRVFTPMANDAQSRRPGILREIQFFGDVSKLESEIRSRMKSYDAELDPLVKQLAKRQAKGKDATYSLQIYREIRWLSAFTSDVDRTRGRIAELKQSLEGDADQVLARSQNGDGSYGPGYTEWFMKLYGTVNDALSVRKKLTLPLSFLDRINSPEKLTNYLHSILITDYPKTGVVTRMEADESISILGRLILGDVECDYPFHPQLKEAYLKFLDDSRNPETGCWGTRFVGRDGTLWRMDDVGMTFHIVDLTGEKTRDLDKIARRVLELSVLDFPAGIRMSGKYENHLNWDAVVIFRQAWPKLDAPGREAVSAEISSMLKWCLAESCQPDGSFKVSELDTTFGDAMEYGVRFLCDAGYFGKEGRFWTDREFPEAKALHDKIMACIEAAGADTPELRRAKRNLARAIE